MTESPTLTQRLLATGGKGQCGPLKKEAAAELDRLTEANKALEAENERWEKRATTGDGVAGRLRAKLAKVEAERERLALAICGGEDAPGYANAQTVETLEQVARDNTRDHNAAIDRANSISVELAEARKVLHWYAENARLARLIHSDGDPGRHALAADGGKRARDFLSSEQKP